MSAWVVSKHHIDLLVSAAIQHGIIARLPETDIPTRVADATAEAFGRMLWAENVRSVVYRYRLDGSDEAAGYDSALAGYRFQRYPAIRPAAALKALDCYDYQACECLDYRDSLAWRFVQALRERLGENLPGYDDQPWGFDTPESVLAAAL